MGGVPLSDTITSLIPADGWYAHFEGAEGGVPLVGWAVMFRENTFPPSEIVGMVVPTHQSQSSRVTRADELDGFKGYSRSQTMV